MPRNPFIYLFILLISFVGTACEESEARLPTISNTSFCGPTEGGVICDAEVIDDGELFVFERGFIFRNLSGEIRVFRAGTGEGIFSGMIHDSQIEGFSFQGAYARNLLGTSYSKPLVKGNPSDE